MKKLLTLLALALYGSAALHAQGPPPISSINAGTGVTVTRSGQTVTISSSGFTGGTVANATSFTSLATFNGGITVPNQQVINLTTGGANGVVPLAIAQGSNTYGAAIYMAAGASRNLTLTVGGSSQAASADGYTTAGFVNFGILGNASMSAQISLTSGQWFFRQVVNNTVTLDATSTTSAAEVLSGGLAVQKSVFIGNSLTLGVTGTGQLSVGTSNQFTADGNGNVIGVNATLSGLLKVNTLSSSGNVTLSALQVNNAALFGGSLTAQNSVSFSGVIFNLSNLPASGSVLGAAFDSGNNLVSETVADELARLGVSSLTDSTRGGRPLKVNIEPFTGGLDFARKVQVHRFNWAEGNSYGFRPDMPDIGFIAQEVNVILPEAVLKTGRDPSIHDRVLLAVAINSVRELDASTTTILSRLFAGMCAGFAIIAALLFSLWTHRKSHLRHRQHTAALAALDTQIALLKQRLK